MAVIVAILIGGDLLGIAGMFIAVPIAAILRVLMRDLVPAYPAEPASAALESAPASSRKTAQTAKNPQEARL